MYHSFWIHSFADGHLGCGEKGTLVHCWWECRLVRPLWKTLWNFLRTLKMELPFGPAIPLLDLYPKNPETLIQKNLCTPMFITTQFTIAKCWKQPRCPSVTEWINKQLPRTGGGGGDIGPLSLLSPPCPPQMTQISALKICC